MAKEALPPVLTIDGRLFVKARLLLSPMIAKFDGLPLAFLGRERGEKTAYLDADTAIRWCKEEADRQPARAGELEAMAEALEKLKAQEGGKRPAEQPPSGG